MGYTTYFSGEVTIDPPLNEQETAYLLKSPANAERLVRSVRAVKKGRARDRRLIDG